jgi:predicted acyltransferase
MHVAGPAGRLRSLDIFRGAAMAAMILVNNSGNWEFTYAPLLHKEWHGWTFTDTVYPFFLWIVGVAVTLSVARRVERGDSRRRLVLHALRRASAIFAIGFLAPALFGAAWETIRIPGVLQRIAVCYFIATLIFLYTSIRGQLYWLGGLCAVYWALMTLYPVPGFGPGRLDLPVGNFAQYIDNLVLAGHMYEDSKVWDPEGIVSTLTATATVLCGILAGHLLRSKLTPEEKTAWFTVGGALLAGAGHLMQIWMPINKPIWTIPFVVFMAGLAMLCFGCWYWLADVRGWARWFKPFEVFGMNALAVYVLSGALGSTLSIIPIGAEDAGQWWYRNVCSALLPSPYNAALLYALCNVAAMYGVAWLLYRRGWFVKL